MNPLSLLQSKISAIFKSHTPDRVRVRQLRRKRRKLIKNSASIGDIIEVAEQEAGLFGKEYDIVLVPFNADYANFDTVDFGIHSRYPTTERFPIGESVKWIIPMKEIDRMVMVNSSEMGPTPEDYGSS